MSLFYTIPLLICLILCVVALISPKFCKFLEIGGIDEVIVVGILAFVPVANIIIAVGVVTDASFKLIPKLKILIPKHLRKD